MKISVIVTSYNHEKYIKQCIESILMQKGDFELEIIIGDDFSKDNTTKIRGCQVNGCWDLCEKISIKHIIMNL